MNLLILTGKFGFGHNSAANSIKEKILLENPTYNVKIIDFIEYMFPTLNKYIYRTFNFLVDKCHALYNGLNKIGSKNTSAPLKKVIVKKIDELIYENEANLIISVFPVCSKYISAYKKMFDKDIILNTCITDVDAHEEWISEETNLYFVACEKTQKNLIEMGVPKEKIVISGIPVKSDFTVSSKNTKQKNILIMGGGLGLIPDVEELLKSLENTPSVKVNVIVGNNKKLYDKLSSNYENINIIGFTNQVYKYMKEADLIVTKAGGITMFEAINTETPMFVIKPFLTQEVGNALYIEDNNLGEVLWKKNKYLSTDILNLINNNEKLVQMKTNMKNIKKTFAKTSYVINLKREGESKWCI